MKKKIFTLIYAFLFLAASPVMSQTTTDQDKLKELILQDAQKQGLNQLPDVIAAMKAVQESVIIRAWERAVLATQPVTQEMKNQIYKELSTNLGDSEYIIFQVIVDNEEAANGLHRSMLANPKWEDINIASVIKENIKFSRNKSDWVNLSMIAPEFRPAVRALKVGELIGKPVRTSSGWHVVGLMQKRPLVMPSAETMDKDLVTLAERRIVTQKLQTMLPK